MNRIKYSVERLLNLIYCHPIPASSLTLFATNRCNSKCQICGIWKQEPKKDLPLKIIVDLLESKYVEPNLTTIILNGGEFILHPQKDEIVDITKSLGFQVSLLTNGLLPELVIDFIKEHKIDAVGVSLDGLPETYIKIRGVDGYQKVIYLLEEIHKKKTKITINFVIHHENTLKDFLHVSEMATKFDGDLQVIIYEDNKIFRTKFTGRLHENKVLEIAKFVDNKINKMYLELYPQWLNGLKVPCLSIRNGIAILPNGDIPLCHCKNIVLGNILKNPLDKIYGSQETRSLLKSYTINCNDCWAFCHRMTDLGILYAIWKKIKFLPDSVRKSFWKLTTKIWGPYNYELLENFLLNSDDTLEFFCWEIF